MLHKIGKVLISIIVMGWLILGLGLSPVLAEAQYTQTDQKPLQTDQKSSPYSQTPQTSPQTPYPQTQQIDKNKSAESRPPQEPYRQTSQKAQSQPAKSSQ